MDLHLATSGKRLLLPPIQRLVVCSNEQVTGGESGTTRLEQAVKAHRDALLELTRERVPLDWAMTQNNLGNALARLAAVAAA